MASITIRKLDDKLKAKLRVHAARKGQSMEEAARSILHDALTEKPRAPTNLADDIRALFAPLGGVELTIEPRGPMREPPTFDDDHS